MAAKKKTTKAATKRKPAKVTAKKPAAPKPGETIERTFKGRKITVHITADGFRYGGKVYPSLTALAKHITGYPSISGPGFFGAGKTTKEKGK